MVYRFIDEYKDTFGLRWLLKQFGLSSTPYYNYKKQRKASYIENKNNILNEIEQIYYSYNGVIGYRTMRIFLARKGIILSAPTVHKYMNKELGLKANVNQKPRSHRKKETYRVFPNLLRQRFNAYEKNHIWCTDFTEINLQGSGKCYNCSIIDLYDRSIVATANSKYMNSDLAIYTLTKALDSEHPAPGIILHSDRGSPFTSIKFNDFCKSHGIIQSMSRSGYPYDNAPMERFYNTFKSEFIHKNTIYTMESLDFLTDQYIFTWYNKIRPHSYNNFLTPFQVRNNLQPQYICARLNAD